MTEKYYVIYKDEKLELHHGDKGWYTRRPFTIISKEWQPSKEHQIYDSEVITTIIDKKGNIVPILRLKPHKHIEKCDTYCPCGVFIKHDIEAQEKITETGHIKIYTCKRCKSVNKTETPHDFTMTEPGIIKCSFCGYTKNIPLTPENIRKYAVPPFPLELVLKAWNLTLEEILKLDKIIKEEIIPTKPILPDSTYPGLIQYLVKEITEGTETNENLRKILFQKIPELKKYEKNKLYIKIKDKKLIIYLRKLVEIIDHIPGRPMPRCGHPKEYRAIYEKIIIHTREFPSDKEAFHFLELPSPEEIQEANKKDEEKYERFKKADKEWLQKVKEKVENTETYKKLSDLIFTSPYGRKIAYAVDPYNGIIASRPQEITEDFLKGVKKLKLL